MLHLTRHLIVLIVFLGFTFQLSASPVYQLMTEELHPVSYYQDNGKLTGVAVEIIRLLLNEVDHPDNIQVLPWARAISYLGKKEDHILFAMARTAEREDKYQWVGPIFSDSIYLYQRANNPTFYQQIAQAKSAGFIAVSRNHPEQKFLEEMNFDNLVLTHTPKKSVGMLMSGRVELMSAGFGVMQELVKHAGFPSEQVKRTEIKLFSTDLYIGFSNNIPKQEIQRWQVALKHIKKRSSYHKILINYQFE